MDNAIEQPPREDTETTATCKHCGRAMLVETVTTGRAIPIPHRIVTGSFVQFVDAEGGPLGPHWPVCGNCQKNPLDLPEVQAAYKKLVHKE